MLDEAIAKYKKAKEAVLDGFFEGGVNAAKGPEGDAAGAGTPLVQALDAAVCDVAIAAVRMMPDERGFIGGDENNLGEFVDDAASRRVIAEIKRQFGLPEGSEGWRAISVRVIRHMAPIREQGTSSVENADL
jgi:hypothetical protein